LKKLLVFRHLWQARDIQPHTDLQEAVKMNKEIQDILLNDLSSKNPIYKFSGGSMA